MRKSSAMHQRSSLRSDRASASLTTARAFQISAEALRWYPTYPNSAEKCQMTEEPRFGDLGKRRAENLQAIDKVALLNEQHTLEWVDAAAPGMPAVQRAPCGLVSQH